MDCHCIQNVSPCDRAARNGHLKCLKYAHEEGYEWDEDTCALIARAGYLDCLQYAHENGCPWNDETTSYAAMNGYYDCFVYAVEHGCAVDIPFLLSIIDDLGGDMQKYIIRTILKMKK